MIERPELFERVPFPKRAIAVAVSTVCAAAHAGEAPHVIEEVVVTATKRAESAQDVPIAITAFTDHDIVRQGFKQLDDYAGQIPSLAFGRREPAGTNIVMRGCAVSGVAFSDNPTGTIYLDEQPITVAGFNPDPRLVDIERVEALSGPQGTLFGDASQCGTLRIITNKPDTAQSDGWVDLTAGAVADGEPGYDVSAMANLALIPDRLALRLVGFHAEEAGYIDNIASPSPGGTFDNAGFAGEDVNDRTTSGGRAGLRWQPNEDWTVDLTAMFQKVDQNGFGDNDLGENFFDGRRIGEREQIRFNHDTWTDDWYQIALSIEADLGFAELTVVGSYLDRDTRYEADSTAYMFAWQQINTYLNSDPNRPEPATIYDFGGDPHALAIDDGERDRVTFEVRLATPADSDSRWSGIVGLFYNKATTESTFRANVEGLGDNCSPDYAAAPGCKGAWTYLAYNHNYYLGTFPEPNDNWWHGSYDTVMKQGAAFGEFTYDVTDRFAITAGGRWYWTDQDRVLTNAFGVWPSTFHVPCADPDGWRVDGIPQEGIFCETNERASTDEDGFVPKLNLSWFATDDTLLFATYSEGFRRGGVNTAKPGSVFGPGQAFHEFESDTLKNYEVGAKTTWAEGRLQLNVTAYHMVWEDIQIQAEDPTPNLFTLGVLNFPEAEIDGVEADFIWFPLESLEISGTLGYNDAELSETATLFPGTAGEKTAVAGTRLPISPEWKGSLAAEYQFDAELFGARPYVRADYQFQDESVSSLEGIQSIEFDNPVREQDAYSILDLRVGLEGDRWSAALFIDNVTDEFAEQFFNDRWAQTRLSVNRPRTIGVTFRQYFGG